MYNVQQIRSFAKTSDELESLAARFIEMLITQAPHPTGFGKFVKYSPVEGDQFAFDAFAHQTKMRFKLRHAIFCDGQDRYLAGEFDWYVPDVEGKLISSGKGIQLIPSGNVLLPSGYHASIYDGVELYDLQQLEAGVSMLILHEIQSRMVVIEKHQQ